MKTRVDLAAMLPKHGVGAELGVFRGDYSDVLFKGCNPEKLYLIDLFEGQMRSGDRNGENIQTIEMDIEMKNVQYRFRSHPQVHIVKGESRNWLRSQPSNSLDWVYIDTDHSLDTTVEEIALARNAVKSGGVISGHDYDRLFPGVIWAVDNFIKEHNLIGEVTSDDKLASYFIVNTK